MGALWVKKVAKLQRHIVAKVIREMEVGIGENDSGIPARGEFGDWIIFWTFNVRG